MRCQVCGEREATVLFTQILDDEQEVCYLCRPCADRKGADLGKAVAGASVEPGEVRPNLVCTDCGQTLAEFEETGLLGCASCYEAFEPELERVLKRIHGRTRHKPEPAGADEAHPESLSDLEEQLERAVNGEAFEEAARLRDRIGALRATDRKQ
jgi:protein arginine kinase activator